MNMRFVHNDLHTNNIIIRNIIGPIQLNILLMELLIV